MALRKRDLEPEIPATSTPDTCSWNKDIDCQKEATNTVMETVEIFGKNVKVQFRFCDEHTAKAISGSR